MDFGFCGILDIAIVLLGILFIVLGYKKGFLKKVLSFAGFFAATILSFVYCKQLAQILISRGIIYPEVYSPIFEHLISRAAEVGLEATSNIKDFLVICLDLPEFMAELFANALNVTGDVQTICSGISEYISNIVMNICSFFIILVGSVVIVMILKLITKILRKVKIIRVIDGILGSVLYFTFFLLVVYVTFTIVQVSMNQPWFAEVREFLIIDMQLPINGEEMPFRLSRYIYENNILYKIIEMFI